MVLLLLVPPLVLQPSRPLRRASRAEVGVLLLGVAGVVVGERLGVEPAVAGVVVVVDGVDGVVGMGVVIAGSVFGAGV